MKNVENNRLVTKKIRKIHSYSVFDNEPSSKYDWPIYVHCYRWYPEKRANRRYDYISHSLSHFVLVLPIVIYSNISPVVVHGIAFADDGNFFDRCLLGKPIQHVRTGVSRLPSSQVHAVALRYDVIYLNYVLTLFRRHTDKRGADHVLLLASRSCTHMFMFRIGNFPFSSLDLIGIITIIIFIVFRFAHCVDLRRNFIERWPIRSC